MKALIIKGTAGLLGIGGLTVGGYYGFQALNKEEEIAVTKEKTKDKLINQKYIVLKVGSSQISNVISNYKAATQVSQNLKFAGFTGDAVGNETAEAILLKNCNMIFEKEDVTNEELEKAKRWCVEPTNVTELLKRRNINAISSSDSDPVWKEKIKLYRTSTKPKIEGLDIKTQEAEPSEEELRNIKEKCTTIGAIKNHEDKFENNLNLFENWCSTK